MRYANDSVPAWRLWPSGNWNFKINQRYNEFLLKENILSIQSVLFLHAILHKRKNLSLFFIEYTIKVGRKVSSTDHAVWYTLVKEYSTSMKHHACIKICKNLSFHEKNDFDQKTAVWKCTALLVQRVEL